MTIKGFRAIAARVSERIGSTVTAANANRWSRREGDPLPLTPFAGVVYCNVAQLDAWIGRQSWKAPTKGRRAAPHRRPSTAPDVSVNSDRPGVASTGTRGIPCTD